MQRILTVLAIATALLSVACSAKKEVPVEVMSARAAEDAGRADDARRILMTAETARTNDATLSFELAMLSLRHFDDFFKGEIKTITISNTNFQPFGRAVRMNDIDGRELGHLLRDLSPVLPILDRALARDRRHVQAWLEKANVYAEMNRIGDALATISNARRELPDEARLPYLAGTILLHEKRLPEAERAYAAAADLDDDFSAAALYHGSTLLALDRPADAERAFNRCVDIADGDKDASRALHEMFSWYYERQRFEEAFRWGERHLDTVRSFAKMFRSLGIAAFMSGHYDEARDWLPEAIRKGGDDALALALLGQINTGDGKYPEAEALFRRSLKLRETIQVLSQLGSLYLEKLNLPAQAITVLERAIELQPDHYLARYQLASAYKAAGRDRATELAAWEAYLVTASRISLKELGEHEAEYMKKARARIAELQKR